MRSNAFLLAVAALVAMQPGLATPKTPDNPREAIARSITKALRGGPAAISQAEVYMAIRSVDIDGDNVTDWQVEWNDLGSGWCGTGGCRYQLWLGRSRGAPQRVFDRQMRELAIVQRNGRNVFVFDFHGSECGGFGSQPCPGEFVWDAAARAMVLLPTPARHTSVADPLIL